MTRKRINLDPPAYTPKICEHCGEEYIPTSGRQRVCQKPECQAWKARNYPSRKNGRYVKRGERPSRKKCEWPDCIVIITARNSRTHTLALTEGGGKDAPLMWNVDIQTVHNFSTPRAKAGVTNTIRSSVFTESTPTNGGRCSAIRVANAPYADYRFLMDAS